MRAFWKSVGGEGAPLCLSFTTFTFFKKPFFLYIIKFSIFTCSVFIPVIFPFLLFFTLKSQASAFQKDRYFPPPNQ